MLSTDSLTPSSLTAATTGSDNHQDIVLPTMPQPMADSSMTTPSSVPSHGDVPPTHPPDFMHPLDTLFSGVSPKRKVVGMILEGAFPPDARVEREAVTLIEAGYQVHLLCTQPTNRPPLTEHEAYRGIYIDRIDPDAGSWKIPFLNLKAKMPFQGLFKNVNKAVWNIDTTWHTLIDDFVARYGVHILHVHDLRLMTTALVVAEKYSIPVISDLHENFPALMHQMKGRHNPGRGDKAFQRWDAIETQCAEEATHVITVVEQAKQRLVAKGIPSDKISVVYNTVDTDKFDHAPLNKDIIRQFKSKFLLTYVGHINDTHRGIHTVLEALAILRKEIHDVHIVLAGPVRETYGRELKKIIDKHDLMDAITFTGWLDETEFGSYIDACDICLCPHLQTPQTNATFPNKVYLYHYYGKAVVAGNCDPIAEYLRETGGGITYPASDPVALANAIKTLYKDPKTRREMGQRGQRAVEKRYNWQTTSKTLLGVYNRVGQLTEQMFQHAMAE
jgi:glycosyltransferase involved in cell wall biosynthesis